MLPISSRLHAALASEIFCPQLTPHVCYLVLPHLMTLDFPLTPLLAYLSDVLPTGGLQPSLQLLYSITQLVNPKLGEEQKQLQTRCVPSLLRSPPPPPPSLSPLLLPFSLSPLFLPFSPPPPLHSCLLSPCHLPPGSLSPTSLSQYLRLLAVLLKHAPRDRMISGKGEEEEEQSWTMEVEGEPDPLGSDDELLACCLSGVTGEYLPNRLRQER